MNNYEKEANSSYLDWKKEQMAMDQPYTAKPAGTCYQASPRMKPTQEEENRSADLGP